jgi:hypothetical protein
VSEESRPEAAALNRELTDALVDSGERMGFSVITEFAVRGGRLDVVWTWEPPAPIPGVVGSLPVVGFEIESSWRTRKHVKGDLLNLQDASVALGVIVLSGADARDDSLRRFATTLVDRPGTQVLVWTEDDVRALAAGKDQPIGVDSTAEQPAGEGPASAVLYPNAAVEHPGKYGALWVWLRQRERSPIRITFVDLERQTGVVLPDSCRNHAAHWHSYQGSAVARAIIDAGWHAANVDVNAQAVTLVPGAPPRRV